MAGGRFYTAAGPCSPVRMPDNLLDRLDPDLAVADGSGASSVADNLDNAVDMLVGANKGVNCTLGIVLTSNSLPRTYSFQPCCAPQPCTVDGHTTNISSKQRVFENLKLLGYERSP